MRTVTAAAVIVAFASIAQAAPLASDLSPLSSNTLQLVKQRLAESATDTWVAGTQLEGLLEYDYAPLSVFADANYPPPSDPVPSEITSIVSKWAAKRPSWTKALAYENNGAAADPAALGPGWLVAAAAEGAAGDSSTQSMYMSQVKEQVDYLLNSVPRTNDGAISHRPADEPVQIWADFMYMVPPLLAYYGVATSNSDLIREAWNQCRLYRQYLKGPTGAWKHILYGSWQDGGLWNTGNAWAASGLVRVYATIVNSQYKADFVDEAADLVDWANEVLTAAFYNLKSDGLLPNYYDSASGSSFSDAAGSALLAASAYRLAQLNSTGVPDSTLQNAATIRAAVNGKINKSTGWLAPVVNPLSFKEQASISPEAQAFVLLLESAWRDYLASPSSLTSTLAPALKRVIADLRRIEEGQQ